MPIFHLPRTTLNDLLHPADRARANAAQALGSMQQQRREAAVMAAGLARRAEAERLARPRVSPD